MFQNIMWLSGYNTLKAWILGTDLGWGLKCSSCSFRVSAHFAVCFSRLMLVCMCVFCVFMRALVCLTWSFIQLIGVPTNSQSMGLIFQLDQGLYRNLWEMQGLWVRTVTFIDPVFEKLILWVTIGWKLVCIKISKTLWQGSVNINI